MNNHGMDLPYLAEYHGARMNTELEKQRPFMLMQGTVRVFKDGDAWCALYGVNLQEGVAGFGATPDQATRNFDKRWSELP